MRPRNYTAVEWRQMKLDLLRELALRGVHQPKEVRSIETLRPWFARTDREHVDELVDELASDDDCPLDYVTEAEQAVWITDPDAVPEYVRQNGGREF